MGLLVEKKTWKKPTTIMVVGDGCRVCGKEITNDMSFLAFADKTHAHLDCDRRQYYQQLIEKQKNEKRLSPN